MFPLHKTRALFGLPFMSKVLAACLSLATLAAPGKKPMNPLLDPLYDLLEAKSLRPYVYNIPSGVNAHVFPVPQERAVGTNDLDDAITLFTFQQEQLKTKTYFKRSIKHVSGGGHYLPVFSPHKIGFAKERFFALYDFKKNKAKEYDIVISMERTIFKAGIANPEKYLFLFEIESDNPNSEDYHDVTYSLWLSDLSDDKSKLIKRYVMPKFSTWSIFSDKIFISELKKTELSVLNTNLEPSHHPLVDVVKKHKNYISFVGIVPHPTLPFALLSGGEIGGQYVCWNQTFREERLRSTFGFVGTMWYTFSPDGRWVVFQKDEPEPMYSYLMPISEKYPNYIGSPILLEGATFGRDFFAWMGDSSSLVGSAGGKLYRYDLTKEAHPEIGNSPSFWDYVVDQDLEKLRKEGKQGLRPLKPEKGK